MSKPARAQLTAYTLSKLVKRDTCQELAMIYIVEMLRWGRSDSHHYILGAFSSESAAIKAGRIEEIWCGGRYEPRVQSLVIDRDIDQEKLDYYNNVLYL
jgi:hypothetical protein